MTTPVSFNSKYTVTQGTSTTQTSQNKPKASVFNTDVTRNYHNFYTRDDYNITNNGRRVAMLAVTSDGLAQDAELKINKGPNKGVWRFRCDNGNTCNIGYFGEKDGKITCYEDLKYLELWKDCKSDYYDSTGGRIQGGQKYRIKQENGNIKVNIGDVNNPNWIPLEQFAAMR